MRTVKSSVSWQPGCSLSTVWVESSVVCLERLQKDTRKGTGALVLSWGFQAQGEKVATSAGAAHNWYLLLPLTGLFHLCGAV